MKLVVTLTFSLMLVARADYAPYRGSRNIEDSIRDLTVKHSHDWKNPPAFDILNNPDSPFLQANETAFVELWDRQQRKLLWRKPTPALSDVWISPDGDYIVGLSTIKWNNPYQFVLFSRDGQLLKANHVSCLVAKFSKKELDTFWVSYPELKNHLQRHTSKVDGEFYVDFSFVDQDKYPKARRALYSRKTVNPIYPGARASISNWIWWYDSEVKPLILERDGKHLLILQAYNSKGDTSEPRKIRIEIPNKTEQGNR